MRRKIDMFKFIVPIRDSSMRVGDMGERVFLRGLSEEDLKKILSLECDILRGKCDESDTGTMGRSSTKDCSAKNKPKTIRSGKCGEVSKTTTFQEGSDMDGKSEELMNIVGRIRDNIRERNRSNSDNGCGVDRGKIGRPMREVYSHYHKKIPEGVTHIDTYLVNELFGITDDTGCTQHAVKKLLVSGDRGFKDSNKDYIEAIITLIRGGELRGILDVEGNLEEGMYIKVKKV